MIEKFVAAFRRGIEGELAAMRADAETFEVTLGAADDLGGGRYAFETSSADRVVAGTSGTLRSARGEQRVTIERVAGQRVTIVATQPVEGAATLVVAPWFLYEKLIERLEAIREAPLALTLFGKTPATRTPATLARGYEELNASQRAAVQLCAESDLAFVWGPPGTGKTATLVRVIEELLARGERILLVSTTNAAIDQVLAKVAPEPWFAPGRFVRIGRSDAETFGAEVAEIAEARDQRAATRRRRAGDVEQMLRFARALAEELAPAVAAQQSLFGNGPQPLRAQQLARVFGAAEEIAKRPVREQQRIIAERVKRLERVRELLRQKRAHVPDAQIVAAAQIVLCTTTNAYLSPLLADQRFDTLIAEEAGMATLPPLFAAAARCDKRAIMVGDPRQLPPIVQSDDERVRRAIGRNIFEITVPQPEQSPLVAMLDVQYRMHPRIGALVGALFYGGRLVHAAVGTEAIAARAPLPGEAVAVVDVRGTAERTAAGSRINKTSAERTADLALEAHRSGAGSIAVITPYAGQAAEIRKLLAARRIADAVECATIHRFQGRECDLVILDLVDAPPLRPSGLVEAPNLLNVSVSRARGKLVVVADVAYFAANGGIVAQLLRAIAAGAS